jgi:general secretion pathway protein C
MNQFLLNLQKNSFYVLVPVLLFFSFSTAYLVRSIILIFLNPAKIDIKKNVNFAMNNSGAPPKAMSIYEDMLEGNMIRGKKIIDLPPDQALNGVAPAPIVEEIPGADEAVLTGTISGLSWFARATIKEKDKEDAEEFGLGKKVLGYVVKQIADHYAVLSKNGLNLKVEIGETIKEAKDRHAEMMAKRKGPDLTADNFTPGQKVVKPISRTDFEKYLKDESMIYKDARFGPNMVEGKIDGYKIYQVAASHVFYQLGARNGDVVRRVNGIPLNNTQKMLELWSNIKNSQTVTIDIDRKGTILSYEFQIRN